MNIKILNFYSFFVTVAPCNSWLWIHFNFECSVIRSKYLLNYILNVFDIISRSMDLLEVDITKWEGWMPFWIFIAFIDKFFNDHCFVGFYLPRFILWYLKNKCLWILLVIMSKNNFIRKRNGNIYCVISEKLIFVNLNVNVR